MSSIANLSFDEMYEAVGQRNMSYEGQFITAVTSTGIFCRPSCRARKPKRENVIFYKNSQEALRHGFRPCKTCRPLEPLGGAPEFISNLIKELHEFPDKRIKDHDLRSRGLDPATIRRWFNRHHNMTFQAYQRMLRINRAYKELTKGASVTNTAYQNGFDSLSGFSDGCQRLFGKPPKKLSQTAVINISRLTTPIGPMFVCASNTGICLLEYTDRRMLEREFQDICNRLNAIILPGKNPIIDQVSDELSEYFTGKRKRFDVPLHTPGTEFQELVWSQLQTIPYGHTRSYKEQAIHIGRPKSVRAVANANGMNRVAIIIPCHRVIGSDGHLTGYGGGLMRKRWLLDHESKYANLPNQQQLFS